MKLISASITGFQSFEESGDIQFSDGFNLIVGENNSGKSALLRALQGNLEDDRHRSLTRWDIAEIPQPEVKLALKVDGDEIKAEIVRLGTNQHIPVKPMNNPTEWVRQFFEQQSHVFHINNRPNSVFSSHYPSHGRFQPSPTDRRNIQVIVKNGSVYLSEHHSSADTLSSVLNTIWNSKMFYFSAERLTIGESPHSYSHRLTPNASNLPLVLLWLQGSRGDIFDRLVRHMREIFHTVGNISVSTRPDNNNIEVRVWPTESQPRPELSFSLNSSGTGVSQVLAILTAVMTITNSTILIDEINSFLHPSAVKQLLRILRTYYADHQYIISTHSLDVVSASNPQSLHLVRRRGYESKVVQLDPTELDTLREVAREVGASMSDVFAADRIVWVEGPTEEICFPLIYQHTTGHSVPRGAVFTSVSSTGDFSQRKRGKSSAFEAYARLAKAAAPLVDHVVFSFDTEALSAKDIEDFKRSTGYPIRFLPRRHLECFALSPEAIHHLLLMRDNENAASYSEGNVASKLQELASTKEFFIEEWNTDLGDKKWLGKVDAAKLIERACTELSSARVVFRKTDDTRELLKFILETDPTYVEDLSQYVLSLLE